MAIDFSKFAISNADLDDDFGVDKKKDNKPMPADEAIYEADMIKKIAASGGISVDEFADHLQEQEDEE
jgi:predicted DsbA family dithiol-disulfide isomerase